MASKIERLWLFDTANFYRCGRRPIVERRGDGRFAVAERRNCLAGDFNDIRIAHMPNDLALRLSNRLATDDTFEEQVLRCILRCERNLGGENH